MLVKRVLYVWTGALAEHVNSSRMNWKVKFHSQSSSSMIDSNTQRQPSGTLFEPQTNSMRQWAPQDRPLSLRTTNWTNCMASEYVTRSQESTDLYGVSKCCRTLSTISTVSRTLTNQLLHISANSRPLIRSTQGSLWPGFEPVLAHDV